MKRAVLLWAVLILTLFLAACSTGNGDENNNNNGNNNTAGNNSGENDSGKETDPLSIEDYVPIKEDTRYVYEGSGNEYASYDTYIDYTSDGKFQQRVNNGGTVMAKVFEIKDGKLISKYSRGEAYYRENLLNKTDEKEDVLLKEPLEKGTTWTLSDSNTSTITNLDVDISTPSGDYKALEVTTKGEEGQTIDYYAQNVGLVKTVFVTEGTEITSTLSKIEENVSLMQNVLFYYPNIDDGKYYYQNKELQFHTNDMTKKVLENAYKESLPAEYNIGKVFSAQTKINSLYLNQDGNVYIDLNSDFVTNMNAGAGYEQMILQSIANTFGSYYNAAKVYLTIDNGLYESGHIMMRKGEFLTVHVQNAVEMK
ncbi:GerMN domain-containing protein [Bacillus benzoevorans]